MVLIDDSHIKCYVGNVKTLLSNNFELYIVVQPGSNSSDLKKLQKKRLVNYDDILLICNGTSKNISSD